MPVIGALILSLLLVWAFTESWGLFWVQLDSLQCLPWCCLCTWTLEGNQVSVWKLQLWNDGSFGEDKNAVVNLFKAKLTTLFWGEAGSHQHRDGCCRYPGLEGRVQLLGLCLCGTLRFVLGPWSSGNTWLWDAYQEICVKRAWSVTSLGEDFHRKNIFHGILDNLGLLLISFAWWTFPLCKNIGESWAHAMKIPSMLFFLFLTLSSQQEWE